MIVYIDDIYNYGQYYGDNPDADKPFWLFSTRDYSISDYDDILTKLNISEDAFSPYDYDYIPLFRTSAAETEREYLQRLNNKKYLKHFESVAENFDDEFRAYFHNNDEIYDGWSDFYDERLKRDAIAWCKESKIPYISG